MQLRLVIEIEPDGLTPNQVRRQFAEALREAIAQQHLAGKLDAAIAEELWREAPEPETI